MSDSPEFVVTSGAPTIRTASQPVNVPGAVPADIRERIIAQRDAHRASMHDRADFQSDVDEDEAQEAATIVEEYEPIETLELVMPNGMKILYGPPKGISLSMRLIRMFGDANWTSPTGTYFRVLMCVQQIDGEHIKPIGSRIDGEKLANRLGDQTMEYLMQIHARYWATNSQVDLLVVKKHFL